MLRRRVRIVSKSRLIFSLILIILFSYLLINVFKPNVVEGVAETKFIEIQVIYGETLWELARKFGPENQDIRKSIYQISTFNQLVSSDIYPGQILKIPLD